MSFQRRLESVFILKIPCNYNYTIMQYEKKSNYIETPILWIPAYAGMTKSLRDSTTQRLTN